MRCHLVRSRAGLAQAPDPTPASAVLSVLPAPDPVEIVEPAHAVLTEQTMRQSGSTALLTIEDERHTERLQLVDMLGQ
jgi:hypothetical protein